MALSVQAFLDSRTPSADLMGLSLTLQRARCDLSETGIRRVQECPLDEVAQKVKEVSRAVFLGQEMDLRRDLELRQVGRRVVGQLREFYQAIDFLVQEAPIAEYGCNICQDKAETLEVMISPELGLPANFQECAKCTLFIRNMQRSNALGLGDLFKKTDNRLFLGYRKARFIEAFGGEFIANASGILTHPDALSVCLEPDRVIVSPESLRWLATSW